jgi:hypothetical protein
MGLLGLRWTGDVPGMRVNHAFIHSPVLDGGEAR